MIITRLPAIATFLLVAGCSSLRAPQPDVPFDPDDDCVERTWYFDADDDGHGDPTTSKVACGAPEGWSLRGDDCDDEDRGAFPGGIEVCDGVDRDCDGQIDNNALDAPTWYRDGDQDGFGDPENATTVCEPPEGYVLQDGDCNDRDATRHAGADDPACDGIDQDCSGGSLHPAAERGGLAYDTVQGALTAGGERDVWICEAGPHPVQHRQTGGDLRIHGHPSAGTVVLEPAADGRILEVDGADVVLLDRLTLRGARSEGDGGAVFASARRLQLEGVTLQDNTTTGRGGGAFLGSLDPDEDILLNDVLVVDNVSGADGGGLYLAAAGAELSAVVGSARNVSGARGGGLAISEGTGVRLELNAEGDHAVTDGGGLAIWGADLTITGAVQIREAAAQGNGGGLHVRAAGRLTLRTGLVEDSSAGGNGGGIVLEGGSLQVSSYVTANGCSAGSDGGGLWASAGADGLQLQHLMIRGNSADERGGGAFVQARDGDVYVSLSDATGNSADVGGALYLVAAEDGATASTVSYLSGWSMVRNEAKNGAAAYITGLEPAGRAVSLRFGDLLQNTGGAAAVADRLDNRARVEVMEIDGNTGGGLRVQGDVDVDLRGDLGDTAGNNGPFDIEYGGVAYDLTGDWGACTPDDGCVAESRP